jgi:hypothetical protein
MARFESAKADWPRVKSLRGGGVHISGRYVQPRLAKAMPALFGLIVLCHSAMLFAATASIVAAAVWGALMALLYPLLWKRSLTNMLGRMVDVRVEPDRVRVRQGLFYRNYDRRNPIAFRIEPCVYTSCAEVVMQYGERRIVIAEISLADIGHAQALLARLCEAMGETASGAGFTVGRKVSRPGSYSPYSSAAHLYG